MSLGTPLDYSLMHISSNPSLVGFAVVVVCSLIFYPIGFMLGFVGLVIHSNVFEIKEYPEDDDYSEVSEIDEREKIRKPSFKSVLGAPLSTLKSVKSSIINLTEPRTGKTYKLHSGPEIGRVHSPVSLGSPHTSRRDVSSNQDIRQTSSLSVQRAQNEKRPVSAHSDYILTRPRPEIHVGSRDIKSSASATFPRDHLKYHNQKQPAHRNQPLSRNKDKLDSRDMKRSVSAHTYIPSRSNKDMLSSHNKSRMVSPSAQRFKNYPDDKRTLHTNTNMPYKQQVIIDVSDHDVQVSASASAPRDRQKTHDDKKSLSAHSNMPSKSKSVIMDVSKPHDTIRKSASAHKYQKTRDDDVRSLSAHSDSRSRKIDKSYSHSHNIGRHASEHIHRSHTSSRT